MTGKVRRILAELRQRLETLYGHRLVRLVLFGSQARGDAAPGWDSDIDVLVVLRGPVDSARESERIGDIRAELSLEHSMVISCVLASERDFLEERSPLLINIRREGVPVSGSGNSHQARRGIPQAG